MTTASRLMWEEETVTELPVIKRGTAARLGLRRPIRGLLRFPSSMSPARVEQLKAWFNETWPTGHRYVYLADDEGIDLHSIEMEELRGPRRRWWRWKR